MKIICKVKNHLGENLSNVKIEVTEKYNVLNTKFKYDKENNLYLANLDIIGRDSQILLCFTLRCTGYETLNQCNFIHNDIFEFVMGPKNSMYLRCGDKKLPFHNFNDYFGIIGSPQKVQKIIKQFNFQPTQKIKTFPFYVCTKNSFFNKNELKNIRKQVDIEEIGNVFVRQGQEIPFIFAGKIRVKPTHNTKEAEIKQFFKNQGASIVGLFQNEYIIQVPVDILSDLANFVENIYETGFFISIYPILSSKRIEDYQPGNFLSEGQYVNHVIELKDGWSLLNSQFETSRRYGIADIIFGVDDGGLIRANVGGVMTDNHSFTGNVTKLDGIQVPKIKQRYNFVSHTPDNDTPFSGSSSPYHGINVCGILLGKASLSNVNSEGTVGVIPEAQVFSVMIPSSAPHIIAVYGWISGLESYTYSLAHSMPKLDIGVDVIVSSIASRIDESTDGNIFSKWVKSAISYGRNGRGLIMVFSGGNENSYKKYVAGAENRFSVYKNVLSIGATSFYSDYLDGFGNPIERKTVYSNFGKIDFCAPSSNGGIANRIHNPVQNIGTWTPTLIGKGDLPGSITLEKNVLDNVVESHPIIETGAKVNTIFPKQKPLVKSTSAITAGATSINVASTTDFRVGMQIWIVNSNDSTVNEFVKISGKTATSLNIDSSTPIVNNYAIGSYIYPYPILVSKITTPILDGSNSISVDYVENFTLNMWIKISGLSSGESVSDVVQIIGIFDKTLTISPSVTNAYSTSNTRVKAMTTLSVEKWSSYKIGQNIEIENISQGMTQIYSDLPIVHKVPNYIIVDGINRHTLESNDLINIRRSTKISSNNSFFNEAPLPANYNPTSHPNTDITVQSSSIFIDDSTVFVEGTMIHIETDGGDSEWAIIGNVHTDKIDIEPKTQFSHPKGSTTVTSYPTITSTFGAIIDDFLEIKIQELPELFYVKVIGCLDSQYALTPINTPIAGFAAYSGKRAFPVKLDNISGLSTEDIVLLGKPEFNLSTRHENSETLVIEKVDSVNSRIFVKRILKNYLGNDVQLFRGEYDYTSSFGGTSSACPTVGGVIGLMLSANPDLTWVEIVDILRKTADKIDLNCRGYELPASDEDGILDLNENLLTYRASDTDETKRPAGVGRWKNKTGDYILKMDGTPTSVVDTEPDFSEWYGYGRVNAKKAVQGALNYNESQRDLMIRDTLTDEGIADNIGSVHSPDIWILHTEVDYVNDSTKPDFSKAPPHENPKTDSDRYIYARIKNKGELLNNLECTVRFYIALCDGTNATGIESPFLFPDDWSDNTELSEITSNAGTKQTYFVDEVKIKPDKITPGGGANFYNNDDSNKIVSVKWNELDIPPSATNLKTYLLVQVSPHDGSRNGLGAESNSNLSFREIVFADFQFKKLDGGSLPNEIEIEGLETRTSDFEIEVKTLIGNFITENVEIIIERHNASGIVDNAIFKYNFTNSTWELKDGGGATPSWSNMSAPVEIVTSDPATGVQKGIKFSGNYSVDKQFSKVRIKAIINSSSPTNLIDIPVSEGIHDVAVYEAALNPSGLISSPGQPPLFPQSYTFTDFADLNTQLANLAFGPSTGSEANKFRVTSSFTASTDVKAYAMVNGFVMIQPGAGADKVNLILRPFTQPIQGFSKVKYIIYRGLRLDEFIDTNDTTKVVAENSASNSEWITQLYSTHHNLNPSGDFLSKALGYDPSNQSGSDLIDDYFFSTNADFQLPFISRGTQLGKFFANGGSNDFGIDIILEDRKFTPNLDYVRTAFHEIDIAGLPMGSDAEKFTKRIKQDEILNFMDLAAFYGIHHTEEGKVRRRNGSNNTETIPLTDLYSDVIDKFATRNAVYIDIRNELGDSLNFFTNYNDGSGNQIQLGTESGTLAPMAYQTNGWPILIKDNASAPFDTDNDFNEIFLQLRVDDNLSPMLFVKHGDLSTTAVKNKFVEGDNLISGTNPWTNEIGLTYPNTGTSGSKLNVSWFLKLNYSRKLDSNTIFPDTVVQTNYYADNLFGSIDAVQPWNSSDTTQWTLLQSDQYVDGSQSGFGQVSEKGIAIDQAQSTDRVILYANLTDDFVSSQDFTPSSGQTSGTSQQESFLTEPMLFKGYNLDFNIINSSPNVITLRFKPNPDNPISEQNTQILGLTKNQMDSLKLLSGYDNRYPRTVVFDKLGDFTDANGKAYSKFKLGVHGLDSDGHYSKQFPATDLETYSLDELFFTSADFANLEPTPTEYTRDTEENNGAKLKHPAKTLIIENVDIGNKKFNVKGKDAIQLTENEKVTISGSAGNNGTYTVKSVVSQGTENTIIEIKESIPSSASPFGQLAYSELAWEDYFISLDQNTSIANPSDKMETIVANFISVVNAVPNNETAPSSLEAAVNTYAPIILERARAIVNENFDTSNANPDDRILYWTRLKMLVILKSHPYLLGSIFDRDRLVLKFEDLSRGYSTIDFSGASSSTKKILITGFDPFFLQVGKSGNNIYQSNPSGASALYLHGKNGSDLGVDALIQTAMIPVRYKDFDEGIIDRFFDQFMAVNKVDLIITISQGRTKRYDIERWSSKYRNSDINDNDNVIRAKQKLFVPDGVNLKLSNDPNNLSEFFDTTLPYSVMVNTDKNLNVLKQGTVIYNQGFTSTEQDYGNSSSVDNGNVNNGITPATGTKARRGSGGNYLSNEIYYRVSLLKNGREVFLSIPSGHLHVPILQSGAGNFNSQKTKELIQDVISIIIKAT